MTIRIGVLSKPKQFHLLRSLHRLARGRARMFAFAPADINWQQQTVRAHVLQPNGRWRTETSALPDVIYNRLLCGRATESSEPLKRFRKRIDGHGIPFFNRSYFNKSDIFRRLHNSKEAQAVRHLPETLERPTADGLARLLTRHRAVFLKPTGGYAGFGIYKLVSPSADEGYVQFHNGRAPQVLRFPNRQAMIRYLQKKTRGFRRYIAQQGIALLRIRDCPVDFRVHANRNGQNQWVISGIGAKKAGRGSVTTHLRTGGAVYAPLPTLRYFFGNQAADVYKQLRMAAIRLAQAISRQTPHLVGELGFDMGVDEDGRIWMFEANSKPGRSIFKHRNLGKAVAACDRNLLDYCLYLGASAKGG